MTRSIRMAIAAWVFVAVAAQAEVATAKPVGLWNPATVETITGTVESIERIEMGDWACVRLRLKTEGGALALRVAPDWYLAEKKISFSQGERLEVTGSRLRFAGEASMVAGVILRGAEKIVLRDPTGRAAWSGK